MKFFITNLTIAFLKKSGKSGTCLNLQNDVACFKKTDKFIIIFFHIFKKIKDELQFFWRTFHRQMLIC